MNNIEKKAEEILKKNHQEHIISIMQHLSEEKRLILEEQILDIDFKEINRLYETTKQHKEVDIEEIDKIESIKPEELPEKEVQEYLRTGKKAIRDKKLAVAIMAGGQGTRLRTRWT